MGSLFKKFRSRPVLISFVVILIGVSLYWHDYISYSDGYTFLDLMEKKSIDLRFRSRGTIHTNPKVVLAVIDEKSIDKEGKWVWPRSKIAKLVTKLSDAGAKVIAFDIIFSEPDNSSVIQTLNNIENKIDRLEIKNDVLNEYLNQLKSQSDNDTLLANAIQNAKAKVVLGYFFQIKKANLAHLNDKEMETHENNSRGSRYNLVRYSKGDAKNLFLKEAALPVSNISQISDSTPYSGYFNMFPDKDGVIRWIPSVFKFKDDLYAPLSLKTIQAYLDKPISVQIESGLGIESLKIGDLSVPTDEQGRIMINYRGDSDRKTFLHISITDILNGKNLKDIFRDKIVLVGATAVGIYDLRVTPFSENYPGVEIHANLIDSILAKDFLYKPEYIAVFDILAIILMGLFLGFTLPKTGALAGAVSSISLVVVYVLFCQYLFSTMGWVLNLVYPLCVVVLLYVALTAYKYLIEENQKRFIKNAFSTYLAPTVVKELMDSPEKLNLGGEQREITAFFSDVQGFTSISEKLSPQELVELLNEFLTEMTDVILKYEGTVDKFEGDAIIAFFGAPNHMENHAEKACMASIDMQASMVRLREKWRASGKPELKMRIGLYTGPAVVGNMGSKNRMDYTMMGDTVNTAARLEGVNKIYGIYLLAGETTCKSIENKIKIREIDSIHVVGKTEPVSIYQLVDYQENIDDRVQNTIDNYVKGLYAYRKQEWDKAINFFKASLEISPDDGPSKTMLARCNDFKSNPPGQNWNGSFTMSTK